MQVEFYISYKMIKIIHASQIFYLFFQNYKNFTCNWKFLSIFYFDASCMQFSIKMKFLKEFTWYYMNYIFSPSNSAPATVQLFVTNKSKFIVVSVPKKIKIELKICSTISKLRICKKNIHRVCVCEFSVFTYFCLHLPGSLIKRKCPQITASCQFFVLPENEWH